MYKVSMCVNISKQFKVKFFENAFVIDMSVMNSNNLFKLLIHAIVI